MSKFDYYARRYAIASWQPKGVRPNFDRCAASVHHNRGPLVESQCSRKCGHGPEGAFCKQHAAQYK